jgi:ADP-heptose:LPS heptosyltransferase
MNHSNGHIIAIRFSALGDVAMTIPVIRQWLEVHPDMTLVMVSRKAFAPLFQGIDRLIFHGADLQQTHKGVSGLFKLFRELHEVYPNAKIADLHGVLRARILTFYFRLFGHQSATIDKGRQEKKHITRKKNKSNAKIASSFERYAAVFSKVGFSFLLDLKTKNFRNASQQHAFISNLKHPVTIGIAPFAKHPEKMYPIERMRSVLERLSSLPINIMLFGGGKAEIDVLKNWSQTFGENVHNLAGRFTLYEELEIIAQLDLMVSMDSANMHLASLFDVPVVSIWGPTDPITGFFGWGQSSENMISIPLECRPCSVYGNKPCWRGDHACMQGITEEMILSKIMELLSKKIA